MWYNTKTFSQGKGQKKKMKSIHFSALLSILAIIILIGMFSHVEAGAQEQTCQIRASQDNIYLYVRDMDRDGNPTRRIIYRGWLMQGSTLPVKSRSGRITVSYKADSDYRGSGRNEEICVNDRIVSLP
jgi:hypothetical protein